MEQTIEYRQLGFAPENQPRRPWDFNGSLNHESVSIRVIRSITYIYYRG